MLRGCWLYGTPQGVFRIEWTRIGARGCFAVIVEQDLLSCYETATTALTRLIQGETQKPLCALEISHLGLPPSRISWTFCPAGDETSWTRSTAAPSGQPADARARPAASPPRTTCRDIFWPALGESDVTNRVARLSSSETKIAARSTRIGSGATPTSGERLTFTSMKSGKQSILLKRRLIATSSWDLHQAPGQLRVRGDWFCSADLRPRRPYQ
jgi:hypothetical protein